MPRTFSPSQLTERVVIQRATTTADNQGGRSTAWGTFATVWAQVRSLTSRETVAAKAAASKVRYEVAIRVLDCVDPSMRLQWVPSWSASAGTKVLEISGIRPDGEAQRLRLDCGEGV